MQNLKVFGSPVDLPAVQQIENCLRHPRAIAGALMADHHLGYSMPIGGVVAYDGAISPTGVGFDIACGNMAVKTNLQCVDLGISLEQPEATAIATKTLMREIQRRVAFGMGRSNSAPAVDDPVLEKHSSWREIDKHFGPALYEKAVAQLGTVGSGNHYVDLLHDPEGYIWIANHFGSRGLGHTIASGFLAAAANRDFTERVPESEDPVVLEVDSELGAFYIAAMHLAGRYAYAGREYVTQQVLNILGAEATFTVHNHHNFAWLEDGVWVVRKGATPLTTEPAYIGGSMGEGAVIVRGKVHWPEGPAMVDPDAYEAWSQAKPVNDIGAIGSAPHGAGRVMSRTAAAGKMRKYWVCPNRNCNFEPERCSGPVSGYASNHCPKCSIPLRRVRMRDKSTASIDWDSEREKLTARGVVVLGAGADESPGVYKSLAGVLQSHPNIDIVTKLSPVGVVMAGPDEYDPYKD